MKVVVRTQSGSVYTFDTKVMTWERDNPRGWGGDTYRAGEGELVQFPEIVIGEGMRVPIADNSRIEGWDVLYTTPVIDFENVGD